MAGVSGRRGGWTRASTNDGDVTGPSTSIAAAIPLASTVFPAPSGPESTTTSPARNWPPSREPSATVSSKRGNVAMPDCGGRERGEAGRGGSPLMLDPVSVTPQDPIAHPLGQHHESAWGGVLDQPHQSVV